MAATIKRSIVDQHAVDSHNEEKSTPGSPAGVAGINTGTATFDVQGFVSPSSVNSGETVRVHARSQVGTFSMVVYRLGYYGAAGAREVYRVADIPGRNAPTPPPDSFGTVDASSWPGVSFATSGWISGYYVVAFVPTTTENAASYAPFVVREDGRTSDVLVNIPFATYQAYNNFGGKSLYSYSSLGGAAATKVSFDRPYVDVGGLGHLFAGDYQMIWFLEREGYDVTYATSVDEHRRPDLMDRHRVLATAYHDEYWSRPMRDNLVGWIGAGKSVAFLSANNLYWQIRYEPSPDGRPDTVIVCYRDSSDPIIPKNPSLWTTTWRTLGLPESDILGANFEDPGGTVNPWVVTNASHWLYAGTGLRNGDVIDGLVGTEWDRASGAAGDATIVSDSPIPGGFQQNAIVRETKTGSVIFAAGTLLFAWYLGGEWPPEDTRVQRMFTNMLDRAGVHGNSPPTSTLPPSTTTTAATTTTAPSTTTTAATAATSTVPPVGAQVGFVELEDGPNNLTFESAAEAGGTGRGSLGYWYYTDQFSGLAFNAPFTGAYVLRLRYATPNAGVTRAVTIDGLVVVTATLPSTGAWGTWRTVDIPVTLAAGTRSIQFRLGAGSTNVDNVTLLAATPTGLPTTSTTTTTTATAPSSTMTTTAPSSATTTTTTVPPTTTTTTTAPPPTSTATTMTTTTTTTVPGAPVAFIELEDGPNTLTFESAASAGGTGRGSLGYWYYATQYAGFSFSAPTTRQYVLRLRYSAPGTGATRAVFVDDVLATTAALPSTGDWSVWRTVDIPVSLSAGAHTIQFRMGGVPVNVDNVTVL